MSNLLTRCALYGTLGITLDALGLALVGTLLVLVLFMAVECLGRIEGHKQGEQHGSAYALSAYLRMTADEQAKVQRMIKQWEQEK